MATYNGTSGNDSIAGTNQTDTFNIGGSSTVTGAVSGLGNDTISGRGGSDTASYALNSASQPINLVSNAGTTYTGSDGLGFTDTLERIEIVIGGAGNDTINAASRTSAANLQGGGGDNVLTGSTHNDTILGGTGNDVLVGGAGSDTLDGGAGSDTASYAANTATQGVNLAWNNTTTRFAGTDGLGGTDQVIGVETILGGAGDDTVNAGASTGTTTAFNLSGGAGADALTGGAGNDTLAGGTGNDALAGGAGNDSVVWQAGDGADTVTLGAGANTLNLQGWNPAAATTAGTVSGNWTVSGTGATRTFTNSAGGSVTVSDFTTGTNTVICFYPGTRVRTPSGEVAVETLEAGDLVLTAEGDAKPVRWLGRQTVSTRFADPLRVLPVRVAAGALGENLPARDLLVSPDHALLVDGVLVQAGALVNGASVRREDGVPPVFTYYHVELADHSLVLAEGVPAETFIDNVDRLAFDNWAEHETAAVPAPMAEMALPRAKAARQVPAATRRRLAERAALLAGKATAAA